MEYRREVSDRIEAEVYEEYGSRRIKGKWYAPTELSAIVRGFTERKRNELLPSAREKLFRQHGFASFRGRWYPADLAREREADWHQTLKEDREKKQRARRWGKLGGQQEIPEDLIRRSVVLIENEKITGESSRGTGFILNMDGQMFVITNQHVIVYAKTLKLTTASGVRLKPKDLAIVPELDIVRISFDADRDSTGASSWRALPLSYLDPEIDEPVFVCGNSGGAGVITRLEGKVNGVAHDRLETSAQFVAGNSGSPVLDVLGKVVGIATYATYEDRPDWVTKGTPFEGVRRFALRITDQTEWQETTFQEFLEQSYKLADVLNFLVDIYQLMNMDVKFMETYTKRKHNHRYYDDTWCTRVFNIVNGGGLLRAVTTELYPVEMRMTARNVGGLLTREISAARHYASNTKWSTELLANDAQMIDHVADILIDMQKAWTEQIVRLAAEPGSRY